MKNLISRKLLLIAMIIVGKATFSQSTDTLKFAKYRNFVDYVTHVFKDKHPELSFFKQRIFPALAPINIFDCYTGKRSDSAVCTFPDYLALANGLSIANYNDSGQVSLENLQQQIKLFNKINDTITTSTTQRPTPISLTFVEFSELRDTAIVNGYIGFANNQFTENCPNGFYPFKKNRLFAASALNQLFYTPQISFVVNDNFILSNIANKINNIAIDFADGNGFVNITKGVVYPINYNLNDTINIKVKLVADTATYFTSFDIVDSTGIGQISRNGSGTNSTSNACGTFSIVQPDEVRAVTGSGVTGKYGIWYSQCGVPPVYHPGTGIPGHPGNPYTTPGKIRKPYIISAGFNPGNGKQLLANGLPSGVNMILDILNIYIPFSGSNGNWRGTCYETYNGVWNNRFSPTEYTQCHDNDNGSSNGDEFLNRLRDEGYDIIIVTYDDGEQSVLDNVKVFKQVIKDINKEKQDNGFYFENVVQGYSSGAVTTRLALAELESEYKNSGGPHPHTKLWVSQEGEMQGCNVPLGVQYQIDWQADPGHLFPVLIPSGFAASILSTIIGPVVFNMQLKQTADQIQTVIAGIAKGFNENPTAYELTSFTSLSPNGPTSSRTALLNTFANVQGNTSNGYPEFARRVGISQGSSEGINHAYGVDHAGDGPGGAIAVTALMRDGIGDAQLPVLNLGGCGGQTFTCHFPHVEKKSTSKFWSSTNPGYGIFNAYVNLSAEQTIMGEACWSWFGGFVSGTFGPFNIGNNVTIGYENKLAPVNPTPAVTNYDDAPASSQAAHIELYDVVLKEYNSIFLQGTGTTNAYVDWHLHAFAPTVSTLDLHDPTNSYQPLNINKTPFGDLNLMNINNANNVLNGEPNHRFGFPHLSHPNDHYKITPYDGVYAIGQNNGADADYDVDDFQRPNNQFHNEDPQPFIGDYLVRTEAAPRDLYLSNRDVNFGTTNIPGHSQYIAQFEARNSITTGNGIYGLNNNQYYLTPDGDFSVSNNSKIILQAPDISILSGSNFANGEADINYVSFTCAPGEYRLANNTGGGPSKNNIDNNSLDQTTLALAPNAVAAQKTSHVKVYPNPSTGTISIAKETDGESLVQVSDLSGQLIYKATINNAGANSIDLSTVQNGVYLLQVFTGTSSEKFKIMIVK